MFNSTNKVVLVVHISRDFVSWVKRSALTRSVFLPRKKLGTSALFLVI